MHGSLANILLLVMKFGKNYLHVFYIFSITNKTHLTI